MADKMPTSQELRQRFKAMPKEVRDAHQSSGIRIWRGPSWLERSENASEADIQFICLWIANALSARLLNHVIRVPLL